MNKRKIIISALIGSTMVVGSGLAIKNVLKHNEYGSKTQIAAKQNKQYIEETNMSKEISKEKENKNLTDNSISEKLKDGEFFGESKGYAGSIKVKVTVKNGKMSNIDVLAHSETPSFYEKGKSISDRIISKNSVNVNTVSGATFTSNGIKEAVKNALKYQGLKKQDIKVEKISDINNKNEKNIKNINKIINNNECMFNHSKKIINNKNKVILHNTIKTESKKLKDGEYYGIGKGFNGNIRVKTIIKNGKINDVQVLNYNDDLPYITRAKKVITNILKIQNISNIDNVSGATYSSKGILQAINESISKAIVKPTNIKKIHIVKNKTINELNKGKVVVDINKDKIVTDMTKEKNVKKDNRNNDEGEKYKPIDTTKFNINDGEYVGRGIGLYKDKSILSRVIFKNNTIKKIILADGGRNDDYGDDEDFKQGGKKILDYLYKDRDKTINDLIEYEFIRDNILNVVNEKNIEKCVAEGKKYLGSYGEKLRNIDLKHSKHKVESQVRKIIKEYFKKDNRGEALDAVSGATYSAIGITKSVNAAINNAKNAFESKKYIKDINVVSDSFTVYKDELNNEEIDKLFIKVEYSDNTYEIVKYKNFKNKGIKIFNNKTKKEVTSLKELYTGLYYMKINNLVYEKNFEINVLEKNKNDIISMEYSLDDGKWLEFDKLNKYGESIKSQQIFNINETNLGKKLSVRLKTRDGRKYKLFEPNLNEPVLINEELKRQIFKAKKEDIYENSSLGWGIYNIVFVNQIKRVTIQAKNKILSTWQVKIFDPMFGVKATSANGDDITSKIKIIKNTIKNTPGKYEIDYSVTDDKGITLVKTITITVIDDFDED